LSASDDADALKPRPLGAAHEVVLVPNADELVMLPWLQVVAALGGLSVRFRVLRPPYAAVGVGALRALRVQPLRGEFDGAFELIAGYDGYERI
jgi:hypothetical protein